MGYNPQNKITHEFTLINEWGGKGSSRFQHSKNKDLEKSVLRHHSNNLLNNYQWILKVGVQV